MFDDLFGEEVVISPAEPPTTRTSISTFRTPRIISQEALLSVALGVMETRPDWTVPKAMESKSKNGDMAFNIEHFCAPVIHPSTGKMITKWTELANDPEMTEILSTALGKEWGVLAQGNNKTGSVRTDSLHVLDHKQIKLIPKDHTITYDRIVVNYRAQKADPNRVRITVGGNLIKYPRELKTRTADLTTAKILWNSVLSTERGKFMCLDIKKSTYTRHWKDMNT